MPKPFRFPILALTALVLAALACNASATQVPQATLAAQTVNALLTASASAPASDGASATAPAPTGGVPPSVAPGTPTSTLAEVKPTDTSAPTNTPGVEGCTDGAQYVADVTVPDDTVFAPGTAFTKTWRLRNTGTCTWVGSYSFAFIGGQAMSGPPSVPITGNVAPGSLYDVSVNLVAPNSPGTHKGTWQLRNSANAFFGTRPFVQIVVPAASPTHTASSTTAPSSATPTLTLTPTASATNAGAWNGVWDSNCGISGCGQLNLIQTGNTVAGTYAGGAGTIAGTVNGSRLTGTWTRGGNSGTIDFFLDAAGQRFRGNYDKYYTWCGQRSGQSAPSPCGAATWYGNWDTLCGELGSGACGAISLNQTYDSVSGTYAGGEGSITGTVNGAELTGTWSRGGSNGTIKFFMLANGQQFQGNYNSTEQWCGHRSGGADPAPCFKN
jgi:hypothetical protein